MDEQRFDSIIDQLHQHVLAHQVISRKESITYIDSKQEKEIEFFLTSDKKVLLALTQNPELTDNYFKELAQKLWIQEPSNVVIPLYISLPQLKNPFTELIKEGLSLYGLAKEEQEVVIKSSPEFILILIGYDQLKTDRPRNLYVTNKLERCNIRKMIITCNAKYIESHANYHLFFMSYQNKNSQREFFQEINLAQVSREAIKFKITESKNKFIDDSYWKKILVDDLEELFNNFKIQGFKKPPTLNELQSHQLNQALIVNNNSQLNARADVIKNKKSDDGNSENFIFKQLCFLFLRYSKKSDLVEKAAANAITILNNASVSFAWKNLSHIKVPGANLKGINFHGANLEKANLEGVNISQAILIDTNFTATILEHINFIENPTMLCLSADIAFQDERLIAVRFLNEDAELGWVKIYDVYTQQELVKIKTEEYPSVFIDRYGKYVLIQPYSRAELWDINNNKVLTKFNLEESNFTANFDPNHRWFVFFNNNKLKFISLKDFEIIREISIEIEESLNGSNELLRFSNDSALLGFIFDGIVNIWNTVSFDLKIALKIDDAKSSLTDELGEIKGSNPFFSSRIVCICFDNSNQLIFCGSSKYIYGVDLITQKMKIKLVGHTSLVRSMDLILGKDILVSGGDDCLIVLWSIHSFQPIKTISYTPTEIRKILLNTDLSILATVLYDRINYWNLNEDNSSYTTKFEFNELSSLAYNSYKNIIALCHGLSHYIYIMDSDMSLILYKLYDEVFPPFINAKLSFNLLGNKLYIFTLHADEDKLIIIIWDMEKQLLESIHSQTTTFATNDPVCFRADGAYLIFVEHISTMSDEFTDNVLIIWDLEKLTLFKSFNVYEDDISVLDFCGRSEYVLIGYRDGSMEVLNIQNGQFRIIKYAENMLETIDNNVGILSLAINPSGKVLAMGGALGYVLFLCQKEEQFKNYQVKEGAFINHLSFISDNILLLFYFFNSASYMVALDIANMTELTHFRVHHHYIKCILKLNLSQYITANNNTINLWHIVNNESEFSITLYTTLRSSLNAYGCNLAEAKGLNNKNEILLRQNGAIDNKGFSSKKIFSVKHKSKAFDFEPINTKQYDWLIGNHGFFKSRRPSYVSIDVPLIINSTDASLDNENEKNKQINLNSFQNL